MTNHQEVDWHELCATFSVRDHVSPGAFIAEVLLFDRLIIPVVPTQAHGLSANDAKSEWIRWQKQGWDPARQGQILGILNNKLADRIVQVPWTKELQSEWALEMDKRRSGKQPTVDAGKPAPVESESIEFRASVEVTDSWRNGYYVSGGVLQQYAPAMAKTVVAVSPFRSVKELEARTAIRRAKPEDRVPASSLIAVLGFELLVPPDPDKDDFGPLVEAVEVASTPRHREARTALYRWQQKFIRSGVTDGTSIRAAVSEMQRLVEAVRGAKKWTAARKVLNFFKLGAQVASLGNPVGGKVAEAFVSAGEYLVELPGGKRMDPLGVPVASLVLDARERLDWGV